MEAKILCFSITGEATLEDMLEDTLNVALWVQAAGINSA